MRMKKILTEWRRFIVKEAIEKSNFEKIIFRPYITHKQIIKSLVC